MIETVGDTRVTAREDLSGAVVRIGGRVVVGIGGREIAVGRSHAQHQAAARTARRWCGNRDAVGVRLVGKTSLRVVRELRNLVVVGVRRAVVPSDRVNVVVISGVGVIRNVAEPIRHLGQIAHVAAVVDV